MLLILFCRTGSLYQYIACQWWCWLIKSPAISYNKIINWTLLTVGLGFWSDLGIIHCWCPFIKYISGLVTFPLDHDTMENMRFEKWSDFHLIDVPVRVGRSRYNVTTISKRRHHSSPWRPSCSWLLWIHLNARWQKSLSLRNGTNGRTPFNVRVFTGISVQIVTF